MKKFPLFLAFITFLNCSKENGIIFPDALSNSPKTQLVSTFGGTKNDCYQSVVATKDGGFAVLGYTQSADFDINTKTNDSFDFLLVKYNANNSIAWQKTYGGSDDDRGADLICTNDGGFALLGFSKSNDGNLTENAGAQDFWLIKTDKNGNILWQKTFGFAGADIGRTLIQTNDNGFLITGVLDVSASNGQGNSKSSQKHAGGDVWAIKLNAVGTVEWRKYFGGSFTDTPLGIEITDDNSYVIAASSDSNDFNITNNKGTYDFWVLKISSTGNLIWQKNFGGSEIDEPSAICKTNDGNFIIVGDTRSADKDVSKNFGAADLWMIKISTNGDLIWQKTIGGSSFDVARAIYKSENNGYFIAGNSRSSDNGFVNKGQNDAWILHIDELGNLLWQKFIGGNENDFLYDITQTSNNSLIAVGESSSNNGEINLNKGFSDALLIKLK